MIFFFRAQLQEGSKVNIYEVNLFLYFMKLVFSTTKEVLPTDPYAPLIWA